ncbi:bacteriophytochrome (light-regulated signal transduction histidine kinase) [Mycolicibacterium rhodesiae NBB3]|jgi:signal transduction histidine kinase|uniref:histidine kinase n=1 Tax=Mycolicibacterium rhodesiae (strain NBB3) TaxID=710685 RepID=G8RPQ4_MYCRN|nr:ATP-binding protein [Mycolicibacterium rhodesiae]AEV72617.1 bacteriophytochrome (light-regulated signal transduction histidine kinase) [Mycolicibacterium rhodesiae NBB3]
MKWRPTVQGWQNLVFAIMGAVVLAGAIAGTYLLNRTDDVFDELTAEIGPMRVAAYQLQAALRDQETSVRGYAISANPQFLEPYVAGQKNQGTAAQVIRDHAGDRKRVLDDLEAIERTSTKWRAEYAEPLIADVKPMAPAVVDSGTVARGKGLFDSLRQSFDLQLQHLQQERESALDELAVLKSWRNAVLIAVVIALLVAAILSVILIRTAVTRPLEALAASCRRITDGDFSEKIVPQGPRDIRAIAADVEGMRQRMVEELEATQAARSQLAEQALELQRSNAELEQFAYVASHDLQEPLRKVASFCQLIEKRYGDKLDERGTEYIAFAVDGAKRMQILINDLLTFSRVGRLNPTQADVDLGETLDQAIENLDTSITESGAEIVRQGEPLPHIVGDPTLLAMVWQNLIGNAVKFKREGVAPRIVIDCEKSPTEGGGSWTLTVTDNGIGIPEEFSDKVFVIFQRLHGRDVYTGTGIGLALCKKIIEHHGGSIWIDNSFTGGTRFRFTIPVAADDHVAANLEGAPS